MSIQRQHICAIQNPYHLIELLQTNSVEDTQTIKLIIAQLNTLQHPLADEMASDLLRNAIERDNMPHVRFWSNHTQNPMLHGLLCLQQNKFDIFNLLLENEKNRTHALDALLVSVGSSHNIQAVNFLIEHGADPSYRNHLAVRTAIEGGTDCVMRLLEFFDPEYGSLILATAITHQRYEIIQHLLELGADPLDDDDHAFDEALKMGDEHIVAQLLKHVQQLPPSVVFSALHFKVEPKIMNMLFQQANREEVRDYIYNYASENILEQFEHISAVHQKQVLAQHLPNPRLSSSRKI